MSDKAKLFEASAMLLHDAIHDVNHGLEEIIMLRAFTVHAISRWYGKHVDESMSVAEFWAMVEAREKGMVAEIGRRADARENDGLDSGIPDAM